MKGEEQQVPERAELYSEIMVWETLDGISFIEKRVWEDKKQRPKADQIILNTKNKMCHCNSSHYLSFFHTQLNEVKTMQTLL